MKTDRLLLLTVLALVITVLFGLGFSEKEVENDVGRGPDVSSAPPNYYKDVQEQGFLVIFGKVVDLSGSALLVHFGKGQEKIVLKTSDNYFVSGPLQSQSRQKSAFPVQKNDEVLIVSRSGDLDSQLDIWVVNRPEQL